HEHGVDDLPLIVQDRYFTGEGIVDYEAVKSEDGTRGDHLLLNGALMRKVDTNKRYVRLRLLNASNRTNFKFELNDGGQFFKNATDCVILNYPLGMKSIILGAGERDEIVLDLNEAVEESVHLLINNFKELEINI